MIPDSQPSRLVIYQECILLELYHVRQLGHQSSFHPLPPVQYRISKAKETNSAILIHCARLSGNQPLPACRNTGARCLVIYVFTARVRSTREGNINTWECLSVHHQGGYPVPGLGGGVTPPSQVWMVGGGVPYPRSGLWGVYPSQVWMVAGVPHPRSGWWGGVPRVPPRPDLNGGGIPTPAKSRWWGVPHLRSGWWGGTLGYLRYPQPGLDGKGVPQVPPMTGWGTPHHDWMGYPPPS